MEQNGRPSVRRALATLLTGALVGALAIVGVTAPAQAAGTPTVIATEAPRAGGLVTVSGHGFAQQSPGVYITVAPAGASGFYSATGGDTVWVAPGNSSGSSGAGRTEPMIDGSFSFTMTVPAHDGTARSLYVSKAHGQGFADKSQDVISPIAYAAPVAASTTTTLTASPEATAEVGTAVTFIASVAPEAEGSVVFSNGSTSLGESAVANGSATLTAAALPAGQYSVTASFVPEDSAAYASSTSSALSYTVTELATPEPPTPTVTVSKTSDLDAAGETVTVTGTGFVANAPATNGTRPPLAGSFTGAYIVFGSFADEWKPSESAPASARKAFDTKWGLLAGDMDKVGGPAAGAIAISADGSFTTTLRVSEAAGALAGGNWGVYTYPGGGARYAPFETYTPVSFATAPVDPGLPETGAPAVTVSPASDLDPNVENVLTVTGTGFTGAGAANGAYVLFGETSVWSGGSALPSAGWIAQGWVTSFTDGRFTTTLTIPKGALDPSRTYQVATSAAHGLSVTDRSLDTFTPVTVKEAAHTPVVTVEGTPQAGASLTVSGSGFTSGQLVAVEVHSTPYALGSATVGFDGRFTVTGTLPADFPAGAHTVVAIVDGVELASAPVTVAAAAAPAPVVAAPVATCTAQGVSGASLSWGVKESFVSYVNGPIAKGSASISWGSGSGAYNTSENLGRVNYGGSAVFTGHGGILDLTLSNPTIQVNGAGSATLSAVANGSRVAIATLSLPAASVTDGAISWRIASATLTSAGAALFSYNGNAFYPAGTALDPVSFTFPLGAEVPCDASTSGELAATGGQPLDGGVWFGLGLLVLGAALVAARRRALVG